jgi:hypothetical protein
MAVDSENITCPRTPLPDGPSKSGSKRDPSSPSGKEGSSPSEQIQVPSTNPHNDVQDGQHGQEEDDHLDDQVGESKDIVFDDKMEISDVEHKPEKKDDFEDSLDLPPMNWPDFQDEYTKAIAKASREEDELLSEFDRVFAVSCSALADRLANSV